MFTLFSSKKLQIPKPIKRPRRLRRTENLRRLVKETRLSVDDLIYPLFISYEKTGRREISSMPGQCQLSIPELMKEVKEVYSLEIPGIILFGIPEHKDELGSDTYNDNGIIQRAVRAIKEVFPDLLVITDVCFCEYTDHGHCGVLKEGEVDNDLTLKLLAKQVVSHAKAGADMVAPSCMMDGMVKAIRTALDNEDFEQIPILSYAVKYASSFYGPFREAAESTPKFGHRKGYQMDPANVREALKEAALDVEEGADILMVKPALAYLDIIRVVREKFDVPVAAYNVSGEYSMIKTAAQKGWIDEEKVMLETLTAIKRAGADIILTYFAKDVAKLLG